MDLLECRNKLDVIDKQIVKLFEERMDICGKVAETKIASGKAVYDAEREKQKLDELLQLLPVEGVRVVHQGVEGAYSHAAAIQYFGRNAEIYHVARF